MLSSFLCICTDLVNNYLIHKFCKRIAYMHLLRFLSLRNLSVCDTDSHAWNPLIYRRAMHYIGSLPTILLESNLWMDEQWVIENKLSIIIHWTLIIHVHIYRRTYCICTWWTFNLCYENMKKRRIPVINNVTIHI